jgi:hypothetical protein
LLRNFWVLDFSRLDSRDLAEAVAGALWNRAAMFLDTVRIMTKKPAIFAEVCVVTCFAGVLVFVI